MSTTMKKNQKRNYDVLVSQGFENISYVLLFNISIHISRKTANSEPGFETRIHSFASKITVQNRLQSHHTLHTRQKLFAATIVNCAFEKQTLCIIFWMAHNPLCLFKWIVYLPRKLNQPTNSSPDLHFTWELRFTTSKSTFNSRCSLNKQTKKMRTFPLCNATWFTGCPNVCDPFCLKNLNFHSKTLRTKNFRKCHHSLAHR